MADPTPNTAAEARKARVRHAHAQLEQALEELADAHRALPDEEYDSTLPSALFCGYKPTENEGSFQLLGHVTHLAAALEHSLHDPGNAPFREELLAAFEKRFLGQLLD